MKNMNRMRRVRRHRGAAGQQYAIIVGLIGVIALFAVAAAGSAISQLFAKTANTLGGGTNVTLGGGAGSGGGGGPSGTVFSWGRSSEGQIGNGITGGTYLTPVAVVGIGGSGLLSGLTALTGGDEYSCGLQSSGTAVCWGYNGSGGLGNGVSGTDSSTPVQVLQATGSLPLGGISQIAGGGYTTCAIAGGNAHCWGRGDYGNIGDGTTGSRSRPYQVSGVAALTSIATATYQSCASNSSGVWCWGQGAYLGYNSNTNSFTPVQVHGVGNVGNLTGIAQVDVSYENACARSSSGAVYCWGPASDGANGDNTTSTRLVPVQVIDVAGGGSFLSNISQIEGGGFSMMAIDSAGQVYGWGYNAQGNLGDGTSVSSRPRPVKVLGPGGTGFLTGASQVSAAYFHSCALVSGQAYCWGLNNYGRLGNNSTTASPYPVAVLGPGGSGNLTGVSMIIAGGNGHTAALK